MRVRATSFLCLTVVAALAFGGHAVAATAPPADGQSVTVTRAGFSVTLPAEWTVFDPTRQESREVFDAAIAKIPELEGYSDLAAQGAQSSVLNAIGPAQNGAGVSFGVSYFPERLALDPVSLLRNQLRRTGIFENVRVTRVTVARHQAVRAQAEMVGSSARVALTTYEVIGRKGLLFFTFGSADPSATTTSARSTMASLELLR